MDFANNEVRCYNCAHKRTVPGDCHIKCVNPDPNMTGSPHGMARGWFIYPHLFDPIWMTKRCDNYEEAK